MDSPNYPDLTGSVAVITGGAGALGSALALAMAGHGMRIAILDRRFSQDSTQETDLRDAGAPDVVLLETDVCSKEVLGRNRDTITAMWGRIDHLINAAGGNHPDASTVHEFFSEDDDTGRRFDQLSEESLRATFDLNFLGTLFPCQVMLTELVKTQGSVVNFSSMNALRPLTKIPAYSAAKCAISNFTQWLATHVAGTGLRVNAVAPGFFLTEQLRFLAFQEDGELTPRYKSVLAHTPMDRFGEPEDLTGPILFLCSHAARFITGVTLPVDGGFNAYTGV